ncbi:hypothetical protein SUGI_0806570 [Cryptomeria japonica]|uniref:probable F-box protein At2g36090 n=1 Tax=Cryptomeria japonica TaxID=3369 RepID=UPI0024147CEB|nr:probable F-box protein At2g36090 [Cryptomeria japonica]GLJ39483.1 hypothetical protein SUGI_0806570 [Cryptomeria japonica]
MAAVITGEVASLSSDLVYEILSRLDGTTLASAACACVDFCAITREEGIWEDVCGSLWPSIVDEETKSLIHSLGGFRKFYADCFPLITNEEKVSAVQWDSDLEELYVWSDYSDDEDEELQGVLPSDFVSIVDVRFKDKVVYSKVLWGIPDADDFHGWFSRCPFRIDLLNFSDEDDNPGSQITVSVADGLPQLTSIERERKDGKFWRELQDSIRLSWILVNKRLKQAVNLASWSPLGGQRHWPTDNDFLIHFGSILPSHNILPCKVVQCIIGMKCRVSHVGVGENAQTTLKIIELSMQLEDLRHAHLNGKNSLLVLKRAMSCRRSRNYSEVLESCHQYSKAQSELKEEKMRSQDRVDRLCIVSAIAAFASFWYFILFSEN